DLALLSVTDRVLGLTLVDALELTVVLGLLVDASESVNGILVVRLELVEDRAIGANRVLDLAETFLVHRAETRVDFDLFAIVLRGARPLFEHGSELRPLLEGAVDAVQIRERVALVRNEREDVSIRLFRFADVRELLFEHAREPLADHRERGRLDLLDAQHVRIGIGEVLPASIE